MSSEVEFVHNGFQVVIGGQYVGTIDQEGATMPYLFGAGTDAYFTVEQLRIVLNKLEELENARIK